MTFIDDIILLSQSKEELSQISQVFVVFLTSLGFLVNKEKSVLIPCQSLTYLGFIVDSVRMTLSLPEEKLDLIIQDCHRALVQPQILVRDLAKIIGRMSATTQAILPAPLHYRSLQSLKNAALRAEESYEAVVALSSAAKQDLRWWI